MKIIILMVICWCGGILNEISNTLHPPILTDTSTFEYFCHTSFFSLSSFSYSEFGIGLTILDIWVVIIQVALNVRNSLYVFILILYFSFLNFGLLLFFATFSVYLLVNTKAWTKEYESRSLICWLLDQFHDSLV